MSQNKLVVGPKVELSLLQPGLGKIRVHERLLTFPGSCVSAIAKSIQCARFSFY